MVPMQVLTLEQDIGYHGEYAQTDTFLYHLQLHKVERTAIALKTHAVGRHLAAILKKGNAPTEGYHPKQRPMAAHTRLLQTKMPVPSQCHEDIAQYEQQYGI